MTIEEIKGKLNSMGSIKVIFEPKIYDENRIQKKNLQEILEKSKVSLRGWSFPHIPIEDREDGKRPFSPRLPGLRRGRGFRPPRFPVPSRPLKTVPPDSRDPDPFFPGSRR